MSAALGRVVYIRTIVSCCLPLVVASAAAAQVCLEMPIAPAGWGAYVGFTRAGAAVDGATGISAEAASGFEVRIGRDAAGPYVGSLGWSYGGYDRSSWDTQAGEQTTWAVSNHLVSGRVALPMGAGPLRSCPLVDVGGFLADVAPPHNVSAKGLLLGVGWGLEYVWRAGRTTITPFLTPRLLILATRGTGDVNDYPYDGNELLPKGALRVGASVALRTFFVAADVDVILPGGDPRFWMRQTTSDHRAATRFGVRGGVVF